MIFYPVLNEEYACQIAQKWNTRDEASGYVGYVLEFEVTDECAEKYTPKIVGSFVHTELWVPAEELEEFNDNIIGEISVIKEFRGLDKNSSEC